MQSNVLNSKFDKDSPGDDGIFEEVKKKKLSKTSSTAVFPDPSTNIRGAADSRGFIQHRCFISGFTRVIEKYHPLLAPMMEL